MADFSSLRVMIIEDDLDIMRVIAAIIRDMGITEIEQEKDPVAALERFADDKQPAVHLIISDWMMPQKSGLDVLQEVRKADANMPFLMITAKADPISVRDAAESKVSAYIAKPFTPEDVKAKVTALIRKRYPDLLAAVPPLADELEAETESGEPDLAFEEKPEAEADAEPDADAGEQT